MKFATCTVVIATPSSSLRSSSHSDPEMCTNAGAPWNEASNDLEARKRTAKPAQSFAMVDPTAK